MGGMRIFEDFYYSPGNVPILLRNKVQKTELRGIQKGFQGFYER